MQLTVKYKLYLSKKDKKLLDSWMEESLEVYNYFVKKVYNEFRKNKHFLTAYTNKKELTKIKKDTNKYQKINRSILNNLLFRIEDSWKSTFKKWKNKDYEAQPPKEKKRQNILELENGYKLENNKLCISKIGTGNKGFITKISYRGETKLTGKLAQNIIIRRKNGRYYLYLTYEVENDLAENNSNQELGLDWGISNFLTDNTGIHYRNNLFITEREKEHKKQLKRKARQQNHKSNRYKKTLLKIRKINNKEERRKKDAYFKLSLNLSKQNKMICIEDLELDRLHSKKLHHGKAMNKSSSSFFFEILEHQCKKYGCKLIKVNPAYTSKTCNCCGYIKENLRQKDRDWTCPNCQTHFDRDTNAAINILHLGQYQNDLENQGISMHVRLKDWFLNLEVASGHTGIKRE